MRGGSGWQLFLYPCIREQMCAGAAHGKYSVCGASGAVLRRGCCILRKLNPKSSGYRQFDGVPRQYVWGVALRACLLENKKYPSDLDCRGVWHSGFGRSVCISRCDSVYGNAGGADCVLCLCHSVSDFHGRRCDFVRYSAGGIAENRDSENGGSQIRR